MAKISYPKSIQEFFKEITDRIRVSLDPDFILIAGSFGKESWLYSENKLISDFEFVFVCDKRWSLKRKKLLLSALNRDYSYEISLKGYLKKNVERKITSNYSSKYAGYLSLDFFDTFSSPIILYNKNDEFLRVDCRVADIPVWEAWRLYVNRMGDLLKIDYSNTFDEQEANYFLLKIFESTADAYCIINMIYHKNIKIRLEKFHKEIIDNDIELNEICKKSFPILHNALVARDQHNLILFNNDLGIHKYRKIINSWMNYFNKKLIDQENILTKDFANFDKDYLINISLQKKYLGFDKFSIILSNTVRLIAHPELVSFSFKFYHQKFSWRHLILLCVASTFYEQSIENGDFLQSKKIASYLIRKKVIVDLNKHDFIQIILGYWKILR